ncbi:MAG: cytochrome c [Candidatus Acidiferrales bacterium]
MKMRRTWLWVAVVVAAVILLAGFAASRASISALDEPGRFETMLTTKAKHQVVGHAAAQMQLTELAYSDASAHMGELLFSVECASCHGKDGRKPTHIGQSMYPRVPDLGSAEIQKWSDADLFWIVQHGIRLSGMPGFKEFNTDEQVWHLVHFIRTLPNHPKD